MPRQILIFVLLFGGCASVSEYYSPEVAWSDWLTVGSCGHKFELFRRELADGVSLEILGPYLYIFRLEKGKTVQFKSKNVKVTNIDTGSSVNISISHIKTGVLEDFYHNLYKDIKEKQFNALDEIKGTGKYEQMEMNYGEWSAFRGKRDIFRINLDKPTFEPKSTIKIDLPIFLVQGIPVKIEPITFKWKKGTSLACVQ